MRRSHSIFIAFVAIMVMMAGARVSGYTTTSRDYVDRDTYVSKDEPITNYGGTTEMHITGNHESVVYVHFSLTNRPIVDYTARLYFYVDVISTFNYSLTICFWLPPSVPNTWDEYGITYDNRPSTMTPFIGGDGPQEAYSMRHDQIGWHSIDPWIFFIWIGTKSELSLCLTDWDNSVVNLCLCSREYGTGADYRMYIEYTYENYAGLTTTIVVIGVVAIIIILGVVANRRKRKGAVTEILYRKP